MEKKYDVVYSLGLACTCAHALRKAKLRVCSGPFDWLSGGGPWGKRLEMVVAGFAGFLELESMVWQKVSDDGVHDVYVNTKNGLIFSHDFAVGVPIAQSYDEVYAKYQRRIRRFIHDLKNEKKVLLVCIGPVTDDDAQLIDKVTMLCKHAGKNIDVVLISHAENVRQARMSSPAPNITKYEAHIRKNDAQGRVLWQGDEAMLVSILSHYKLRHFRRPWWTNRWLLRVVSAFMPLRRWRLALRQRYREWRSW